MFLSFNVWAKPYQRINLQKNEYLILNKSTVSKIDEDKFGAGYDMTSSVLIIFILGLAGLYVLYESAVGDDDSSE